MSKKIVVFGLGYVGLSNAVLLAQHNKVIAVDIDERRVQMVNNKVSPIVDKDITNFLNNKKLNLVATCDSSVVKNADVVVIATPTNYDEVNHYFDTSSVKSVIDKVNSISDGNPPLIVVRSTIPVGFIKSQVLKGNDNVILCLNFLEKARRYTTIFIHPE